MCQIQKSKKIALNYWELVYLRRGKVNKTKEKYLVWGFFSSPDWWNTCLISNLWKGNNPNGLLGHWFMGLAPGNFGENNLVKRMTLRRLRGRCSAASLTDSLTNWLLSILSLPSPQGGDSWCFFAFLGGAWELWLSFLLVWAGCVCQEPRTCASPRVQAGRHRVFAEVSGFEVVLFETQFP